MKKEQQIPKKMTLREIARDMQINVAIEIGELERIKSLLTKCPLCYHCIGLTEFDEPRCSKAQGMIAHDPRDCTDFSPLFGTFDNLTQP